MQSALLQIFIPVFAGQTRRCLRKMALSQLSPVTRGSDVVTSTFPPQSCTAHCS